VFLFFAKTWLLWWGLVTLVILRWFHLSSSRNYEAGLGAADSAEPAAPRTARDVPPSIVPSPSAHSVD